MTETQWPEPAPVGAKASVLAEDLQIDGDVTSTGPVEVIGKLTGSLRAPDIKVAASGHLKGQVSALNLTVQGMVDGKIAAKSLALISGAVVLAEVTYGQISIETGAQLEGTVKRKP